MITRYERQTVVDVETGEILSNWKHDKKEYITVKIETKKIYNNGTNWIKTERHVKHNGQTKLQI